MAETDVIEDVDIVDPGDPAPGITETPSDVPEWLAEPQYEELLQDEGAKNFLSRFQDRDEVVKAIFEKEKLVRSGFKLPKKLTDAQKAELMPVIEKIFGVPEKPEGYEMVRPEEISEELDLGEQTKMEMRAVAKEERIGNAALQRLYETALHAIQRANKDVANEVKEQHELERKETIQLMQKYWGPQEYRRIVGVPEEKKVGLIEHFIRSRAIDGDEYDDLNEALTKTGLRNHPLLFKLMGDAARMWKIQEGSPDEPGVYAPTKGNQRISEEKQMADRWPNTPVSLGGGKPG